MPTSNRIVGITLVVIGVLILLGQMGLDFFGWLWPVLLCVIGAGLMWSWYTRGDDSGKAFSGVLLILLACFFLFMRREPAQMEQHWPFFVLAPGLSLLVMSRVDRSRRDASVPGWIAIAAALVLYFFSSGLFMGLMGFIFGLIGLVLRLLVPLALVGLGGWMLVNHRRREQSVRTAVPEKYEPARPSEPDEQDAEYEDEAEYTELDHSVSPAPGVLVEDADERPKYGPYDEPDVETFDRPDDEVLDEPAQPARPARPDDAAFEPDEEPGEDDDAPRY